MDKEKDKEKNIGIMIGLLTLVVLLLRFLYVDIWSKPGISAEMKLSITNSIILILLFVYLFFPKKL
jgi:hypothetical protein